MENKYNKYFWEFEQKHKEKAKLINEELNKQYENINYVFEKDYLTSICLNFHLYNNELKKWVLYEVLPHFTKETFISYYLMKLTDALMLKDEKKINSIMSSFKEIGLIKDIELRGNKIILITNDDNVVKFKNLFNDEVVRKEFKNRCHSGCEFIIKNEDSLSQDSYIITIRDRFIEKTPMYHSVILSKKGYIIDPARNMIMKLEDYKKLFKPYSIMCISREQMLEEIEKLQETDEEFNQSKLNNVLKLTINRQINYNKI